MEKQELVELINKWKSGDEDSYNIIYNEYHDRMLKIALSHTQVSGHCNMADAEDVVQDAMLKAYINIQSLDDPNKFEGWLTKIVVNKANDYMTSAMKKRNVLQTDYAKDDGEGNTLEFDAEDEKRERQPEIKLDAEVKQNIVQDILSGLSEDQRAVTLMYYYDEMSMKEIAEQLGIEMSTVVGRLQTAKKNIKNEVTAIQKRDDIKLYNLSAIPAIPFFMAMLGTARETASTPVTTVAETLASGVTQGSQNVAQSTAETTKTPVENVPNNSANVAESPTSNVAEEAVQSATENTASQASNVASEGTTNSVAKATTKLAEEGVKATASSATTASGSAIASTTAGASFATKLVVGIAVAAAATGGGIVLKNNLTSNNSQPADSVVEEPTAKEEQSEEKKDDQKAEEKKQEEQVAKPKVVDQEPQVTDESNIINVDIPDGWTAQNESISTMFTDTQVFDGESPVYAIYSGEAGDKTKPFVMISSLDATGLGGTYGPDGAPKDLVYYDDYTTSNNYTITSVSGPLNHMGLEYVFTAGYTGIPEDSECYVFHLYTQDEVTSQKFVGRSLFQVVYFPMGDDTKLDDVRAIVDSFSIKSIGELKVNVDKLNTRFAPSTSAEKCQEAYNNEKFTVFQTEQSEGYTWYRVGSYLWVADNGQGWVTYTPNE